MQIIHTVAALCAAGKTDGACRWAFREARKGRKIALVQPTTELIRETTKTLCQMGHANIKVTEITSISAPYQVQAKLIDHLKGAQDGFGEILLITHAAFLELTYFHKKERWVVIIDELPTVVDDLTLTIPEEHKRLTDQQSLALFNPTYSRLEVTGNRSALAEYASNPRRDQVWDVFQPLARRLLSQHWDVLALTANYHRVLTESGMADGHKLILFGKLNPAIVQGFEEVILLGAMLKESLLYALWLAQGVEFRTHEIESTLRYTKHTNGHLLTIQWLWDRPWSKRLRDTAVFGSTQTVLDVSVEKALAAVGDQLYLYIVNTDAEAGTAERFKRGIKISSVCHGLNRYDDVHQVVYLSALNPPPAYFAFVETLGFNSDELRRSMYLQSLYQAVMRSSLRDPASTAPKRVVVMDRDAAEYLAQWFPGCTVTRTADLPELGEKKTGRPKRYRDDVARETANNAKKRVLKEVAELNGRGGKRCISIIASVLSLDVLPYEVTTNEALMQELKAATEFETGKHDNILISPAEFDASSATETKRGLANVRSVYGIWLDNDGGDLSPDGFRELFPDLWFAAYSTHSNNGHYRLFIPTRSSMTIEADGMIKRMIMDLVRRAGYGDKGGRVHGFDLGKLAPSSLFYIPCRAPGDTSAFFTEYAGEELDPAVWIANDAAYALPEVLQGPVPILTATTTTRQGGAPAQPEGDGIDLAKARYLAVPAGMEMRNRAFFLLGV